MNTSWTWITFGCSWCSSFMRFREFSFARIPRFCQHHRCLWSNAFQSPISQQHISLSAQCIFSHDCFPKFGVTELVLPVLGCQYPYLLVAISSNECSWHDANQRGWMVDDGPSCYHWRGASPCRVALTELLRHHEPNGSVNQCHVTRWRFFNAALRRTSVQPMFLQVQPSCR